MLRLLSFSTAVLVLFGVVALAAETAVKREPIEWCNIWVADTTRTDLPRVLLIGDSICNGYHNGVDKELQGKALVAMLATSSAVEDPDLAAQIKLLLNNYKFAVIHFNNGLHGWDYSEEEYQKDFLKLLDVIKQNAPGAKLILATSTPLREPSNLKKFQAKNERVKARNKIVTALAAQASIPVDDLYSLVEDHPEYWIADGAHFKPEGQALQAKQVAKTILDALAK